MISGFVPNLGAQKPNAKESLLLGTQYMLDRDSYLEFCRIIAANEEPREYVCPGNDETDYDFGTAQESTFKPAKAPQPDEKPAESYAYMIYRALESSPEGKLTLAEIYRWIEHTYPFYRTADPVWKNSIRHNLSLNTAFKKIPRPESTKGKGGYWAINYESQKNGKILKKRKGVDAPVPDDAQGSVVF